MSTPVAASPFAWVHEDAVRRLATGEHVPEGIFYPVRPGLSDAEWRAEALNAGAEIWRAIGHRPSYLVQKSGGVWHVLRNQPRGYGKRRRLWDQVTECGLLFNLRTPRADRPMYQLGGATCLSCRKIVRERFENDLRYGDSDGDDAADAYDQSQIEEMWRVQAEWHQPGLAGDAAYWFWHDHVLFPAGAPISTKVRRLDRVRHREYGDGTVIAVSVIEDEELALVRFDARPEKPKTVLSDNLSLISAIAPDTGDFHWSWVGG